MLFLDPKAARVTWTVLVFGAAVALLYLLRNVLLLFVLSLFFAYLISPLVALAERWAVLGRGRTAAIVRVYLVLVVALVGVGAAIGPRLTRDVATLTDKIPAMSQQLQSGELLGSVFQRFGWPGEMIAPVDRTLRSHAQEFIGYAQQALTVALKWLAGAWVVILIPIFAFFILKDGDRAVRAANELIESQRHRQLWRAITDDVHRLLAEYVRALLLLAMITFVVWSIVLALAGAPYAVVLAAIGGALEFIPLIGPLIAGVIVVSVGAVSGYGHPWLLLGFVIVWRGVQDYASSPLIMGRGIEIHQALVIFGVIAGGEIAGPAGMFLSVPVIAALRIVWRRVRAAPPAGS
jgi:predicted PurR-regulated permease PerM